MLTYIACYKSENAETCIANPQNNELKSLGATQQAIRSKCHHLTSICREYAGLDYCLLCHLIHDYVHILHTTDSLVVTERSEKSASGTDSNRLADSLKTALRHTSREMSAWIGVGGGYHTYLGWSNVRVCLAQLCCKLADLGGWIHTQAWVPEQPPSQIDCLNYITLSHVNLQLPQTCPRHMLQQNTTVECRRLWVVSLLLDR